MVGLLAINLSTKGFFVRNPANMSSFCYFKLYGKRSSTAMKQMEATFAQSDKGMVHISLDMIPLFSPPKLIEI